MICLTQQKSGNVLSFKFRGRLKEVGEIRSNTGRGQVIESKPGRPPCYSSTSLQNPTTALLSSTCSTRCYTGWMASDFFPTIRFYGLLHCMSACTMR